MPYTNIEHKKEHRKAYYFAHKNRENLSRNARRKMSESLVNVRDPAQNVRIPAENVRVPDNNVRVPCPSPENKREILKRLRGSMKFMESKNKKSEAVKVEPETDGAELVYEDLS